MLLQARNERGGLHRGDEPPIVQEMRTAARGILRRIVVRAPVMRLHDEQVRPSTEGPMYEIVAQSGLLVRAPFVLLGRRWRARLSSLDETTDAGATVRDTTINGVRPRRA